jgi:hypothetical protein
MQHTTESNEQTQRIREGEVSCTAVCRCGKARPCERARASEPRMSANLLMLAGISLELGV